MTKSDSRILFVGNFFSLLTLGLKYNYPFIDCTMIKHEKKDKIKHEKKDN